METDKKEMDSQNQKAGGSKAYDAQAKPWTQKPGPDSSSQKDHDKEHTSGDREQASERSSDSKSFGNQRTENLKN